MTTLFYAGAEQAAHRSLLAECGVQRYGLNITNLSRAVKHLDLWDVAERLPDGAEWILYADQHSTWPMVEPLLEQQPSLVIGPSAWLEHTENVPFAPYWTEDLDPGLEYIAVLDEVVKNQSQLRKVLTQHHSSTTFAVTGSSRGIERLDFVVTSAWIAAQKHGETQVWARNKLHRYPNAQKDDARRKHRADIVRLGVDPEAIEADTPRETARLAVVSWQQWEQRHDHSPNLVLLSSNSASGAHPTNGSASTALANVGPIARHDRLLPVVALEQIESSYKDSQGRDVIETTPAIRSAVTTARQCDTCFLSPNCPAFNPGHACAFAIPVEIRTKDQLQAVMRAVVEMQTQRLLFARYSEELDGQGIDPTVSMEMDRFFRLLKDMRDVSDTRDVLRLEMEARGNAGMISRLFGEAVGSNARQVAVTMEADEVIETLDPQP